LPADGTKCRLTWDEWGAWQRAHRQQTAPLPVLTVRDLADRSFLHWFDEVVTAHDGLRASDREQAARTFLHTFDEAMVKCAPAR
jgi:hypothetical protein